MGTRKKRDLNNVFHSTKESSHDKHFNFNYEASLQNWPFKDQLNKLLFFLALIVSIITLANTIMLSLVRKSNPDIWFHLKTGEVIGRTWNVPTKDIFSFTASGNRWITHEWLSEIFFYIVHALLGETALSLLRPLMLVATVGIISFTCLRRTNTTSISIIGICLFIWMFIQSSWDTFVVRPHMISWIFLSLWISLLYQIRISKRKKLLWYFVILQILWANTHGSAVLGPFLLVLMLISNYLAHWLQQVPRPRDPELNNVLTKAAFICAAICFLTPNTWHMVFQSFSFLGKSAFMHIAEWRSPFDKLYTDFFFKPYYYAWIIVCIGSLVVSWKRRDYFDLLLIIFFLYLSLKNQRNIANSFVVLIPIIHLSLLNALFGLHHVLESARKQWLRKTIRGFYIIPLILGGAVVSFQAFGIFNTITIGIQKAPADIVNRISLQVDQATPIAVADFIDNNNLPGPIRNSYEFGGYFIWRLYPKYKVFFDGRADVYGEELFERFFIITPQHFYEDLIKYGINTVAIKMTNVQWVHNFLLARGIYAPAKKHTLVFFDDFSCIYVKDEAATKIVNEFGFQYLHPVLGWQKRITAENFAQARMECERAINSSDHHSLASEYLEQLNTIARSVSNEQMAKKIVE